MPWTTRKTRTAQAASAALIVAATLATTASPATAQDPAVDRNRVMHGFVLDDGELTLINVPGASSTQVNAISDHGEITGFYTDPPMQTQARGAAAATWVAMPPGDPHALVDMWRLPNRVVPDPSRRVP